MAIDIIRSLWHTLVMDMDDESFYSLPVRKRHLIERKERQKFEQYMKLAQLRQEILGLEIKAGIIHKARAGKSCKECGGKSPIFNLDKIHYLDGDRSNKLHSNIAIVCPRCEVHILLSPFTPKDIWELKMKGLSNAEIGRLLRISRERVGKLSKRYQPEPVQANNVDIDRLVKGVQKIEKNQKARGLLKRRTDKRTLRKRILAELTRLEKKQVKKKGGAK